MLATESKITAVDLQPIQQRITVRFNYEVHFTTGLLRINNPLLAQVIADDGENSPKKVVFVVDAGLLRFRRGLLRQIQLYTQRHADVLNLACEPILVPAGEAAKNDPKLLEKIHQLINKAGLCRHSYILAIGGGAVLDLVGYAAATAHRGIRLIRIPTTVLGQNDSGVGVKNGINAFGKKNFLGTFAPPYAVLNDFGFLNSLSDRDWCSGIAEAVKVALIKDGEFFEFIRARSRALVNRDMDSMQQVIYRCAQLHLNHIANYGDPFEMGSSRPLDFGHWIAHKLEYLTDYNLRHGEAVAIGIAIDTTYSYLLGMLSRLEWLRVLDTLTQLGLTLYVPQLTEQLSEPEHPRCVFRGLNEFREHLGGELSLTLLQSLGKGVQVNQVDLSLYKQAILMLREYTNSEVEKCKNLGIQSIN